ncbi:twin-arginine translocase subunit TatB [Natronospirillum operosum]|uniref:Sec-independent protein translocase protein TatB n=1 Tax=Natronospirillum operosum TaxID=2759953 RepID=A0A4Z0WDI2_9GAMM|nr:Sec-independent protein translocase protein TatB [Natronospirillum operosum]TGG93262.1 twin-arginine translocase subunit TatB [Natronospirillum operosum]
MFDMGFLELAMLAGIGLIVLGPERLPVAARTVGRYIGQARRFVGKFQRQIEQEMRLEELNRKIMEDTKDQTFTNNDGTTTTSRREPVENDPGFYAEHPERRPPEPGTDDAAPTEEQPATPDADSSTDQQPPGDRS